MKKITWILLIVSSTLFSAFNVGDTATFTTYIVGPFAGYTSRKVMCQAVTSHAYIFTQEDYYPINHVKGMQGQDIFALSSDGSLFKYDASTQSWKKDTFDVNYFVIKPVSATKYHIIIGTPSGVAYKSNTTSWTDKLPDYDAVRQDLNIKKFAVSPIGVSSFYRVYYMNKKGFYYANGTQASGPSNSWIPLEGIFVDENFQKYNEGDSVWGGVVETFTDSVLLVSTKALTFGDTSNYSTGVDFSISAYDFTAYFTIYTDSVNTPEFRIDLKRESSNGTYTSLYIEFKNSSVYLNDQRVGPIKPGDGFNFTLVVKDNKAVLKYSSLKGVSGESDTVNCYYQNSFDRFKGFTFVFGSNSSSKFYIDDVFIVPYEVKKIAGHASDRKRCFFLLPYALVIYDNNVPEWRLIYTALPGSSEFVDLVSVPYADSLLYLVMKSKVDTLEVFSILKLEDTTGDFSGPPVVSTITDFTGEYLTFSINFSNPSQLAFSYKNESGMPHLLISKDGGSTFTEEMSGFAEWGPFDWTGVVHSFYFENDNTYFAGTEQGVFKKSGTGDWEEINRGILKRFVTKSEIQAFANLVETFPWDAFYNELGPFGVNRDNDDHVIILLSETGYVLSSDAKIPIGYAYNADVIKDNKVEMIQIDPIDTKVDTLRDLSNPALLKDLAYALAGLHLITWDPDEPAWLRVGAEVVGYHILKAGSLDSPNKADTFILPEKNLLHTYINTDIESERKYAFPFIYYLVEKKGISVLRNWWQDKKYQGLLGLTQFARGDGDTALFYEDVLYNVMTGGFKNIVADLTYKDFVEYKAWVSGYSEKLSPYSFVAIKIKNPTDYGVITSFKYKGTITNGLFIHPENESLIVTVPEPKGKEREGILTLPNDTTTIKKFLFVGYDDDTIGGPDEASFRFAIGVDNKAPEVVTGFFHSDLLNKRVNLFIFGNEKIYKDPANSKPYVFMIAGNDTTECEVSVKSSYIDTLPSGSPVAAMYVSDVDLNFVNKEAKILIKGADLLGNDFNDIEIIFNEWLTQKGTFAYSDGSLIIETPDGAFSSIKSILVSKTDFVPFESDARAKRVSPYYVIGNENLYALRPCVVKIEYPGKGTLYRYENGMWVRVEGGLDNNGFYVAPVQKFGVFTFYDGDTPSKLKFSLSLSKYVLNSKEPLFVNITLPERLNAELKLYNASGRVIEVIKQGIWNSGSHVIGVNVNKLPSGSYFLIFKAKSLKVTKKVIKVE